MNIYQWEEVIATAAAGACLAALKKKDTASVGVEIKSTDGRIYLVIPPGQNGNPAEGWSFGVKGEGSFRGYPSLRKLLEECLDETWEGVTWPKEREVGSRVRLPVSVHKRFKKKLVDVGMSIQEFYRRAVDRFLSEEDWLP